MGKLIKLCRTSELIPGKGKRILLEDDAEVIAYEINGRYYVIANTCPHNHSHVMHEGFVDKENYVTCPVHGYRFHIETGEVPPDSEEMNGKLQTYRTHVQNGELYIVRKSKYFSF